MTSDRLTLTADAGRSGAEIARGVTDSLGERVGLAGVLGGLDRQARSTSVPGAGSEMTGFTWDPADVWTRTWWPQGLSTWADAGPAVRTGDRRVVLSAWYARQPEASGASTRISVVDLDADPGLPGPRYAHVLLVVPYRDPAAGATRHRALTVHAGGLARCGNLLLVADTRRGVRVFDLDDVVRLAPDGDRPPGFAYALPQCGLWRARAQDGSRPLRWSFLSLDRTQHGALWLVAGEYVRGGSGARLARFALDPATGLPARPEPVEVVQTDLPSMQGAVHVDSAYVVSASSGRLRRGHLWTGRSGGAWTRHGRALPVGPEDLSYDPTSDRLWTQTEYPGRRYVLSCPLAPILTPAARR